MPHPNVEIITRLYTAFQQRDGAAMGACYAANARFRDPVFALEGPRIGAMWQMLCERGKDLRVEFRGIEVDAFSGAAQWDAWYTFGATGRPVHNVIRASFAFVDGLIDDHHDQFDFHRWAAQAFGLKGRLLGWSGAFRQTVRRRAARGLDEYLARRGTDAHH